jgi:hypothetical protein
MSRSVAVGLAAVTALLAVASVAAGWSKPNNFVISDQNGGIYQVCRDGMTFQIAKVALEAPLSSKVWSGSTLVGEGDITMRAIDPPLVLPGLPDHHYLGTETIKWIGGRLLTPGADTSLTVYEGTSAYGPNTSVVDNCYLFPPKNKRACKNRSWRRWAFDSRTECIAYVEHQARAACLAEREAGPAEFRKKYGTGKHRRHALRNCVRETT